MSLCKDDSILDLLAKLNLQERRWFVKDHWDADLCAVGICSDMTPNHLVYISTFEREAGRYDFQCEVFDQFSPGQHVIVDRGENVDFDSLIAAMLCHLGPSA